MQPEAGSLTPYAPIIDKKSDAYRALRPSQVRKMLSPTMARLAVAITETARRPFLSDHQAVATVTGIGD